MVLEESIKHIGLFDGLSEETVESITHGLERIHIPEGEEIIAENTHGDCLFLICRGKVEITKVLHSSDTPEATLTVLTPGSFFGEMSIVDEEPRSANVRAMENVELLVIPRDRFKQMALTNPLIMFNLIRTISHRLRDTNTRFVDLMNDMISKNRLMAIGMAASKIIHDLKTPLTVIVLTAQLIESIFPDSGEFTSSIVKQTKLIDQLVREVLDFAKGTETPPMIQKVDMKDFLDDIKETYGHALESRNITFEIINNVHEIVYFDEGKIRRVILNIVKNASEAMPDNGKLQIKATLSSNWLQVSITDDGPGVPEHLRDELFRPFVSEGKQHGTGLGLAICKKLVSEHKGRLEYLPQSPHGAHFDIRLPQGAK